MRIDSISRENYSPGVTTKISDFAKRVFDITASFLGLCLLAPFLAMLAIVIKKDSPGPVFYRGVRIGKEGKPFFILKFRTMYENGKSYAGPRVTAHDDSRVTQLGRWLRDTKLNELPQLWNVLRGEMSIVGPRPEDPEFAKTWPREAWNEVLSVRPGITSPASVHYIDEEKLLSTENVSQIYLEKFSPDKMRLDQLYVRYRSFWLDLDTILWTFLTIILRFKAYTPPENLLFLGPITRLARRYLNWFAIDTIVTFTAFTFTSMVWRIYEPLNIGWPRAMAAVLVFSLLFSLTGSLLGVNRIGWSKARFSDIFDLLPAWGIASSLIIIANWFISIHTQAFPYSIIGGASVLALTGYILVRYRSRLLITFAQWLGKFFPHAQAIRERVLIVGPEIAVQHISWLLDHPANIRKYRVIGFIDNDFTRQGMRYYGKKVVGTTQEINKIVEKYDVGLIILADPDLFLKQNLNLLRLCRSTPAKVVVLPDLIEAINCLAPHPLRITDPTCVEENSDEWVCNLCLFRRASMTGGNNLDDINTTVDPNSRSSPVEL